MTGHQHRDQIRLNAAGYRTKKFTDFHFQVKVGKTIINVWPTASKILKEYSPGPAPYYVDILKAVEALTAPIDLSPIELSMPPPQREAYEMLCWWRVDPIGRLLDYV